MISRTMTFRFANAKELVERYKKAATESTQFSFNQRSCNPSDHPFVFAENL